jgi:thiol:disulfide interchange protein
MEKSKFAMVGVIILLSIILFGAWTYKNQVGVFQNKPNWQWSNDWNSDQAQPPIQKPNQNQPIPNQPNQPDQPMNAQNFEQAKQFSKQSGKPILAVFSATWCKWCQKLEQETLTDSSVRKVMSNYVYIKIDTDTSKELVSEYKVRGLPTTLIINSDGVEIKKEAGFMDTNKMREFLK